MTSPSGGSAVNQVKWIYNAFGLVIRDEQEHSGTVTGSTPNGTNVGVDFDPNGNMVRIPTGDALTGAPRKLVWNAWDQLVEVRDDATNALIQRNGYDALYRRTTRQAGSSAVIHTYYNPQWRPVEERLGTSSSPVTLYFWGIRHRDDLVRRDRATSGTGPLNETQWCLMDYFDPMAVINSSGGVQERYSYSAFGVPLILAPDYSVRSSSSVAWEFLFHGQFTDAETGYQNYGFRYYSPVLGRWLSRDPLGEVSGLNLFALVQNSAVNYHDYLGLAQPGVGPYAGPANGNPPGSVNVSRPNMRPTAAEQRGVNTAGQAYGCHNCGAPSPGTKSGNWVADHQPSTSRNPNGGPQRFYPHCIECSRQQGGILSPGIRNFLSAASNFVGKSVPAVVAAILWGGNLNASDDKDLNQWLEDNTDDDCRFTHSEPSKLQNGCNETQCNYDCTRTMQGEAINKWTTWTFVKDGEDCPKKL